MENNELNSLFDEGRVEKIERNGDEIQITLSQETSSYMIANGLRTSCSDILQSSLFQQLLRHSYLLSNCNYFIIIYIFLKIIFNQCDKYDEVKDEGEYGYVKKAYCLENELRLVCENLILSFSFISFKVKKIYTLGD